jgi:circadian clock protein KaiB
MPKAKKQVQLKARKRRSTRAKPAQPRSEGDGGRWTMRLYVAGHSAHSAAAIANLRRICDDHMPGSYEIEIIDLMREPERARADQILAIPTLVRKLPEPARRIIGDLSSTERVLIGLNLVKH